MPDSADIEQCGLRRRLNEKIQITAFRVAALGD